jgi:cytochrome b561
VTFTAHMSAVLFHTLVLRDRLIDRMALWPTKSAAVRAGIRSTHRGT